MPGQEFRARGPQPLPRGSRRRGWRVQRGKASWETYNEAGKPPILRPIADKTRQFQRTPFFGVRVPKPKYTYLL